MIAARPRSFAVVLNIHIFWIWRVKRRIFFKPKKEVTSLTKDVSLLVDRFFSIGDKQDKITEDFRKLKISVDKIQTRSERIKNLDLDQKEKVENKK